MSDAPQQGPRPDGPDGSAMSRLDELLTDRAVFGLDDAESVELDRLLAATGQTEDDAYELAAAALAVAELPRPASPLPAVLRERMADDGFAFDFDEPEPLLLGAHAVTSTGAGGSAEASPAPSQARSEWPVYTMLAVAAGLLVSFWMGPLASTDRSPAQARIAMLDSADDTVRIAWAAQEDAAIDSGSDEENAAGDAPWGDVVWSDARQEGYMRFRGLAANDPEVEQYQLWVFDAERDDKYPVDGGVFDIAPGGGEQVVPIDARLSVTKAVLFAVTVEEPGGVVVSDRSRLPLLASR